MASSIARKRTLTEALWSPELGAAADAFVRGVPQLADGEVVGEIPDHADVPETSRPKGGDEVTIMADSSTDELAGSSMLAPGKVSLSVRIPAELAHRLARTAATRKLNRNPPFSQQEIVVLALSQWLAKSG